MLISNPTVSAGNACLPPLAAPVFSSFYGPGWVSKCWPGKK